jgi:hypothetical protein
MSIPTGQVSGDEHGSVSGHHINLNNATVLARSTVYMDCLVKEAVKMWLHSDNFNSDL